MTAAATSTTRLRPVRPGDITVMAIKIGHAAEDRVLKIQYPGLDSPEYQRATRAYHRPMEALRRLAYALERQKPPRKPGEEWEHHPDGGVLVDCPGWRCRAGAIRHPDGTVVCRETGEPVPPEPDTHGTASGPGLCPEHRYGEMALETPCGEPGCPAAQGVSA